MNTAQNYALLHTPATPVEPMARPLPTNELYSQISLLQNALLLGQNPHMLKHHRHSLDRALRELSNSLDRVLDNIDPLILEALASHPVND